LRIVAILSITLLALAGCNKEIHEAAAPAGGLEHAAVTSAD
jgi:hypothetical protein